MDTEERDVVVFEDEGGNEIELDVVRYFEHKGEEYAILMDFNASEGACHEHDDDCDTCPDCEAELYVFRVVQDGEFEEFVPVEEEMFEEILQVVESLEEEE